MVMYHSPAFHAIAGGAKIGAICAIKRPVSTASVMKSLPPLNAPRQRMSKISVLKNNNKQLVRLAPKNKLLAATARIIKCT